MMSVLERQHSIPDTGAETTKPDSRLVFPPSPTAQGVVDGSWWPRTRHPAAELPALIAAVTDRLGMVDRITLNADAWDTRPQQITTFGQPVVRLDWSGAWDTHTIRVTGRDFSHLDLLVIPPDTATALALTCLAIAAAQNRSPEPTGRSLSDRYPGRTPVGPATGRAAASAAGAGRPLEHRRRASPGADLALVGCDRSPGRTLSPPLGRARPLRSVSRSAGSGISCSLCPSTEPSDTVEPVEGPR
jgi:Family of unknown function (DUF5994)